MTPTTSSLWRNGGMQHQERAQLKAEFWVKAQARVAAQGITRTLGTKKAPEAPFWMIETTVGRD